MMAASTGPHRHRARKSRVASCLNCRDRKLKCDRRMPVSGVGCQYSAMIGEI